MSSDSYFSVNSSSLERVQELLTSAQSMLPCFPSSDGSLCCTNCPVRGLCGDLSDLSFSLLHSLDSPDRGYNPFSRLVLRRGLRGGLSDDD